MSSDSNVEAQARRRRTFAIISHPDAGKTTLTEKFLLYAGAVSEAGAVKARGNRRSATSDWMAMEQERGISVASTVLQFDYGDSLINLLDTPGHRDFSEDTYRVLAAVDAAVMVLDVAKGIEAQTLKLFEVCRYRRVPVLTFLNKYDRPGRDPLELLDEIQEQIGLRPTPVTWPVGIPGDFRGVIDRRTGDFVKFTRSAHGSTAAVEQTMAPGKAAESEGAAWAQAIEETSLLDAVGADLDLESFLSGDSSPLFVGSAITNFGVRQLLDAIVDLAPAPSARADVKEEPREVGDEFSGFVFKMQANMNPAHRDHVAFVRVCSGHFERGMTVTHASTGKPFATKYATSVFGSDRETIDNAFPGDVVGLVNASELRVGDSLYVGTPVEYPRIPLFLPEMFARVISLDTSKRKQFQRGIEQLQREGVVQILHDENDAFPVAGAVGRMQFEVFEHRMKNEFGAVPELSPLGYSAAAVTDAETAVELKAYRSCRVFTRNDGAFIAAFESPYLLGRLKDENPEWTLQTATPGRLG